MSARGETDCYRKNVAGTKPVTKKMSGRKQTNFCQLVYIVSCMCLFVFGPSRRLALASGEVYNMTRGKRKREKIRRISGGLSDHKMVDGTGNFSSSSSRSIISTITVVRGVRGKEVLTFHY